MFGAHMGTRLHPKRLGQRRGEDECANVLMSDSGHAAQGSNLFAEVRHHGDADDAA